jgi:hypothetical protein
MESSSEVNRNPTFPYATSSVSRKADASIEEKSKTYINSTRNNAATAMTSLMDFYALFGNNDGIRNIVEEQMNHFAGMIILFNLSGINASGYQTSSATNILEIIRSYQKENVNAANDPTFSKITTNELLLALNMTVRDHSVNSLNAFYSLFGNTEELRNVVEMGVNQAADLIIHYETSGIISAGTQTSLATNILEHLRLYQQTHPNVPNNPALNNITANDISRAIDMTMHDRSVNSLIDFYAQFGENEELRTVVKNGLNQAADWIKHFHSSGIDTSGTQNSLATNILELIRSHQNLNDVNYPALNCMTANDISRAIDMTMHSCAIDSLMDFYALFGNDEEFRNSVKSGVNRAADSIKHFHSGGIDTAGAQTTLATNILELIRSHLHQNPNTASNPALNYITANDVSRAINMTMRDGSN